jgi:hypothetical protein
MTSAIKITYWAEAIQGKTSIYDLDGIDDFREELGESYLAVVQGRPGDLGGLHELAIEIISNLTFVEFSKFLLGGVAFDVIKSGAKSLILRPFLNAYRKLKDRNASVQMDIEELKVVFQDVVIIIYKITDDSIFSSLEVILKQIAQNLDHLTLQSGEIPFEIHVPVFEDAADDRPCRFRVKLDVDETISSFSNSDYLGLWGIHYDYAGRRVFDVERRLLIENEFYELKRYWNEMEERWRREHEQ